MTAVLRYINNRLKQLRRDKASPLIVSDGERYLLKVRKMLLKRRRR